MALIDSYGLFSLGALSALAAGALTWVLYGRRLNLYLVSGDSPVTDQALIPVTAENGKRSPRENIDLTLTDFDGGRYDFRVGYGTFVRFYLLLGRGSKAEARLNRRPLENGKYYPIRSGARLSVGGREYTLVIARSNAQSELLRRWN